MATQCNLVLEKDNLESLFLHLCPSCPHPHEHIVALGDAVSDSKCGITNNSIPQVITLPTKRGSEGKTCESNTMAKLML